MSVTGQQQRRILRFTDTRYVLFPDNTAGLGEPSSAAEGVSRGLGKPPSNMILKKMCDNVTPPIKAFHFAAKICSHSQSAI
jgi:hypothetical protein